MSSNFNFFNIDLRSAKANSDKYDAAIIPGGWVLASADVISGRTLTSTAAIKDNLINASANWVHKEVVVDNKLITLRGPGDLPAFSKAIIEELEE